MPVYPNGKPLAFILWDRRVGDDDLHVYIYHIYLQMKTKLNYSLDNKCGVMKTMPVEVYLLHALRKAFTGADNKSIFSGR